MASSGLVYQASNAAFTTSTSNGSNSWASGTVVIGDDAGGVALFDAPSLSPGDHGTRCINVTFSGSLTSTVRLYISSLTGTGLAQYLDLTVEEGHGSTGAGCAGFVLESTLSAGGGTLASFAGTHPTYGNGASTWTPDGGSGAVKSYRFTWTLQSTNASQNLTAGATFTWEARSG